MTLDEKVALLSKHAVNLTTPEEFRDRLKTAAPLRVKMGFDPTGPDLHLGHMVCLRRLRLFQDLGHIVTLIIGDFTASIGDPTGRNILRPALDAPTIFANAQTYLEQAGKVLDTGKLFIRQNSDWFNCFRAAEWMMLLGKATMQQMLARAEFADRFAKEVPIGLHEAVYPLLQGHDSVVIRSEIEIGGSDQLFNLHMGRKLQKDDGLPPQVCLTLPILEGTDGQQKMSKSLGNYIGLSEDPKDQFGKIMSIPDKLTWRYLDLLTDVTAVQRQKLMQIHPMKAKMALATEIVKLLNGESVALSEEAHFSKMFSDGEAPENIASVGVPKDRLTTVLSIAFEMSRSDARRMVEQGAVHVDGKRIEDPAWVPEGPSHLVKVGKRRWARITVARE